MLTFSHASVGKILHTYLKEHHQITLNKSSFIYGNMLPDLKRSYKQLPHEPDSWAKHIKNEIRRLSGHKQESTYFGRNYSRRLGVICHFYTDFFSFPHNETFEGSTYQHLFYEWELHKYTQDNAEGYLHSALYRDVFDTSIPDADAAKIFSSFTSMHRDYMKQGQSFENDLYYALQACASTLVMITGNSVIEKEELRIGSLALEV